MTTEGPLSEERVIRYTLQLCETLAKLHASLPPIIHRDIKPTNIIITPPDNAILIDLNAAKHESAKDEDTTLLGTRGYAAPEQYGFGSSGVQTDIYAIGKLMNTMLNGSFSQQTVNSRLSSVINKCTELTPSNRYGSVMELMDALRNIDTKNSNPFKPLSRKHLIPPGFRSGNYANMLVASTYYIFIIWLTWDIKFKNVNTATNIIQQIGLFLMLLSIPLNIFNYANIHNRFPLCNSDNRLKKVLGIALLNVITIIALMIIMLVLISIFD